MSVLEFVERLSYVCLYVGLYVCSDHCICSLESFDRARKAHGTDHDILFVFSESPVITDLSQMSDVTAAETPCDNWQL